MKESKKHSDKGHSHHSFDIKLATEMGSIELAVIYGHIKYWTEFNARAGKNFHDGRTWMYQSAEEMACHFPYLSVDRIKRYLLKLAKLGYIIKGSFNKCSFDKTAWYALADDSAPSSWQTGTHDRANLHDGECEIARPIPYTKTNTENKERESARAKKQVDPPPEKKAHGNEGLVLLTDPQYEKLCQEHGQRAVVEQIVKLEDYMLSTGKKYKDYAATLRNWFRRDKPSKSDAEAQRRDAGSYGTRNHPGFTFNYLGEDGFEG